MRVPTLAAVAVVLLTSVLVNSFGSGHSPQSTSAKASEPSPLIVPPSGSQRTGPGPSSQERGADHIEVVEGISFVMKAIPAGTFSMGCGFEDEPCADAEFAYVDGGQRQQTVKVESFYLAETEATWSLYQACIDAGSCADNDAHGGDNGWGKGERPVIEISHDDVVGTFLPWLNGTTGHSYRLPTEAEWEYAARAGTTTRFSWGDEIDCSRARYGYVSDECGGRASTDPVKSFSANGFGLYDMHGNVWEMVQDCWADAEDDTCREYVLRGGSWLNAPLNLRSAARFRHERTFRESGDGFRLALNAQM